MLRRLQTARWAACVPANDDVLAAAMRRAPVVLGAAGFKFAAAHRQQRLVAQDAVPGALAFVAHALQQASASAASACC